MKSYNSLTKDIRICNNIVQFKAKLYKHIVGNKQVKAEVKFNGCINL